MMQATTKITEVEVPEREVEQDRLQSALVYLLQHSSSGWCGLEVTLMPV